MKADAKMVGAPAMSTLERWRRTFRFEKVDRLPLYTMGGWRPETYERWAREGLSEDWARTNYFGEDRVLATGVHLGTNGTSPFFPRFECRTIEDAGEFVVLRDEHGRTVRHRKGTGSGINQHVAFPVSSRDDWDEVKRRLDPTREDRYSGLESAVERHTANPDMPVCQALCGTFRMLWHAFGDVGMAYALHDDPELIHDIMEHWLRLQTTAISRIMKILPINLFTIMEDMSCKNGMLVSPTTFREFMMPYYKQLVSHMLSFPTVFGVWVDSDGDVNELLPLLLECGINGCFPFEVQSGMDVVKLRETYGTRLVIRGGIDKRALFGAKEEIDREVGRVLPTFLETGGYFISLDHSASPDISLENYMYFLSAVRSRQPQQTSRLG